MAEVGARVALPGGPSMDETMSLIAKAGGESFPVVAELKDHGCCSGVVDEAVRQSGGISGVAGLRLHARFHRPSAGWATFPSCFADSSNPTLALMTFSWKGNMDMLQRGKSGDRVNRGTVYRFA